MHLLSPAVAMHALQAIGLLVLVVLALQLAHFVWRVALRPAYDLKRR